MEENSVFKKEEKMFCNAKNIDFKKRGKIAKRFKQPLDKKKNMW